MDMYSANRVNPVSEIKTDYNTTDTDTTAKKANYGRTFGNPQLSEKAQKYYEELKKKYGDFDFVLVSKDQMEYAKANASSFASQMSTVVLIDEEKIERMASDESYRRQYETILSNAGAEINRLQAQMTSTGAEVQGYGISVNDNGTLSYFAVLKQSSIDQKIRIEKKHAENVAARKEAQKEAEQAEAEERLKAKKDEKSSSSNKSSENEKSENTSTVTVSAGSVDELLRKLSDYAQNERLNSVQTEAEKMVGQHIDFKG